jgi:hypothetical protein
MHFDFRLQGGAKLFPFGLGWIEMIGEGGYARVLHAPAFCHEPDCAEYFTQAAEPTWRFWRANDASLKYLLDRHALCAPIAFGAKTQGAGFVSIDRIGKRASVDVLLSLTETNADGVSIFDDWERIVKDAKDDLNTAIVLRLTLGDATLRDFDIDGFKSGKRLGTVDLELKVAPSAIQFSRDD